jgi:hypothetical protein
MSIPNPTSITKQIEAAINPKLDTLLNNFTPDQQKTLLTAYSNYSALDASGVSNIGVLPDYVKNTYGITVEDAANYQELKGAGINKLSDVQKKLGNASNGSNELTISENGRYFIHTNVKCKDIAGNLRDQSILIDNISDDTLWQKYNKGLMYSSTMTSSQFAGANRLRELLTSAGAESTASMDVCRGVAVYTDSKKTKTIRGYIAQSDYDNLDPGIINHEQTALTNSLNASLNASPAGPPKKEGFSPITHVYDDEKPYVALENNIVTKFYFVSIAVILLYILFRLYEKSR